jgi:hypothetical protein
MFQRKSTLRGVLAVAMGLLVTNVALAASWSNFMVIDQLGTEWQIGEFAIWNPGVTNSDTNDPANCVPSGSAITRYSVKSGQDAAHLDRMYKTLLSAFLAGRKVQLNVSTTTCVSGQPTFVDVAVDKDM